MVNPIKCICAPSITKAKQSPLELSNGRLVLDAKVVALKWWWQHLVAEGRTMNEVEGNGDSEEAALQ